MTVESGYAEFFGPQVPRTGDEGQTPTFALASAAYRDNEAEEILKANSEWHKSEVGKPRIKLFRPNLGEAFSRAIIDRMLGSGRAPLIQSFGTQPQVVVEHALAAHRIRRERDNWLTAVMVLCGLLFLPGLLVWLLVFQIRTTMAKRDDKRAGALATALLVGVGALAVLFLLRMPFSGFWAWYARAAVLAPVVGWFWAKQICERTARDLRERWDSLLSGSSIGAKVPEAVPSSPGETAAEQLRQSLARLSAEQQSNSVFYAGPKGILGMGTRWGSWQLAEDLAPADPGREIHPFRSWDVIKAIHDRLRMLERGPLNTGGFPKPSIRHWIVTPIGENATAVTRPEGTDVEAYQVKQHAVQEICNKQQFGAGDRHYLGVQWTLWDGQLVITMLITVTVLHETLRIEVTGHALGPVHSLFTTKPAAKEKEVQKSVKFWETRKVKLPLVDSDEVVRLAARAPLTTYPPLLYWLGGKLTLPEPFGLRHAWADKPWRHRFMADDALRAATPVLRVVHSAAIKVLEENGVDTTKFGSRSSSLSTAVQEATPGKADLYDA
ncbi:cytochrome d ubiquinol oxidase subunit II [Streptomyces sp. 2BBP-J2]|uniref:cytochrome d ubiquinol oxidase subunit II n=1 Tax=unclassified Streptomyces TaxID=2593676 RepID=UPI0014308FEA|nr:cytochrome d ubiquinol oxidase subunit II [Streptomyces sp. 2BBP-J2]NIL53712.1 cytochrome d ubiquinol oxidase subunit II [Streptomyces sp. 2BBP-J2]